MAWLLSDLRYDPETHTTSLPDGSDVPHTTAILAAVGVSTDFGELSHLSPRLAQQIQFARIRGQVVHADCHSYDDDDLVMDSVSLASLPYLQAWIQLRKDLRLKPLRRERQIWHPLYRYTGILDGIFELSYGVRRPLIDIKTGDPEDAAAHLQTAAYEEADRLAHPESAATERWAVWLTPGRRIPYRVVPYSGADAGRPDADMDFQKFLACLTVYREQPSRRVRVR